MSKNDMMEVRVGEWKDIWEDNMREVMNKAEKCAAEILDEVDYVKIRYTKELDFDGEPRDVVVLQFYGPARMEEDN